MFSARGGAGAEPTNLVTFADGEDEASAVFENLGGGADTGNELYIPTNATVSSATMKVKGQGDALDNYPAAVSLDIYTKDTDKIYEFAGQGVGAWGRQTVFSDNTDEMKVEFSSGGYDDTTEIIMPKGAQVQSASMKLSAVEWDSLLPIEELTSTNDSHFEYDVSMEVTSDGKAYVAYKTFNPVWVKGEEIGPVARGSSLASCVRGRYGEGLQALSASLPVGRALRRGKKTDWVSDASPHRPHQDPRHGSGVGPHETRDANRGDGSLAR